MRLHFAQVADGAVVVACAVLLDVLEAHRFTADRGDALERLEDRARIAAPAAEVVDLADPRVLPKRLDEPGHVARVDVVADLLALVAEDLVRAPFEIAANQ